jgi:hypothetical protein
MQVATDMQRAWDWMVNTQDGVSNFTGYSMSRALANQTEAYLGSSGLDNDGDVDEDARGNAAAGLPRAADADCAAALPVEPTLTLSLNQESFRRGDTMALTGP